VAKNGLWLGVALAPMMTVPAAAQQATTPEPADHAAAGQAPDEDELGPDITVTGARERGAVPGDIKPDIQLSPADIRSYGVSSISELLNELGPQVRSGQGRGGAPVVLLNGRRVSGFSEIRDIPTEAIERVDILPEEAALGLGYRPDQRVVNFVLRRRFRAYTGEIAGGGATGGGLYTGSADLTRLTISRDRRFNLNLHYDGGTALYEADRDIIPTPTQGAFSIPGNVTPALDGATEIDPALSALAGQPVTVAGVPIGQNSALALSDFLLPRTASSLANYRTLNAANRTLSTNATYSRTIFGNVSASLNGTFAATASASELGLGSGALEVPANSPFSPFASPVLVNRYFVEAGAREREVAGNTGHLGLVLNGDVGKWRWSFTGGFDRAFSRTLSDTTLDLAAAQARIDAGDPTVDPFNYLSPALLGDYRRDYARSITTTGNAEATASGPVMTLPAGKLVASLKSGYETSSFDAHAFRSGLLSDSDLDRQTGTVQASVDLPIAKRGNFLGAIGNLSVNANAALNHVSDFGDLKTTGYGVRWSPIDAIRVIASVNQTESAPSVSQLGNPVVVTPDTRVFDYVRGESIDITSVAGGNPLLNAESRRVTKLGLTLKPLGSTDLTVTANYVKARTRDPIASFPSPTEAIEAAFPDRFTRDDEGRLVRIDTRPVNFAREDSQELRWGFNFAKRIGPAPPQRPAGGFRGPGGGFGGPGGGFGAPGGGFGGRDEGGGAPATRPGTTAGENSATPPATDTVAATGASTDTPPAGGGSDADRRRNFMNTMANPNNPRGQAMARAMSGGRLQFAAYHTWHLQDQILIRPGVPVLDLLDGSATGSRGGQPRHEIEVQAGGTLNGYGVRLSGNWQSGSSVNGGTANAPTDLKFSSLATLNLRLFANFQPNMALVRANPWLRGTRVSLNVTNLFDARLHVTDASGATPINYQPDLLDPTGRTVKLSIRKLFF